MTWKHLRQRKRERGRGQGVNILNVNVSGWCITSLSFYVLRFQESSSGLRRTGYTQVGAGGGALWKVSKTTCLACGGRVAAAQKSRPTCLRGNGWRARRSGIERKPKSESQRQGEQYAGARPGLSRWMSAPAFPLFPHPARPPCRAKSESSGPWTRWRRRGCPLTLERGRGTFFNA